MATPAPTAAHPSPTAPHQPRDQRQVDCCIVGGGPGGAVLALLLARQGLRVELLEEHQDFDRAFRGDALHPSVMEIMDQLGLADRLLLAPASRGWHFARGHLVVQLDRWDYWQIGFVIPKGTYQQLRAAGLPALRQELALTAPELADRVDELQDWKQVSLLSVESNRLRRWYRPGLLLIGDAAHVMTPVGGVGINYAIQDAVVAANVLTDPLQRGRLSSRDLATVQRQRELPTRFIQAFQNLIQQRVLQPALDPNATFQFPPLLRLPLLRDIPARLIGRGLWSVRLKS